MSAPSKIGDCSKCHAEPVQVTWHRETSTWYCADCRPMPAKPAQSDATRAYLAHWNGLVERHYGKDNRLADHLYGIRIEDDPHEEHAASFMVICPEHGVLGDAMWVTDARKLRDDHALTHPAHPP